MVATLAGAPSPDAILQRAQDAWQRRAVPAYESFTLPCADTDLDAECAVGDGARFTMRMADGRTYAVSVPSAAPASSSPGLNGAVETDTRPRVLLQGGFIFGPGGAPLGFYRRVRSSTTPTPRNLAPDPLLLTIATVTAKARTYDVRLVGEDVIDGHECYHLALRTDLDHDTFPLSDLWVDEASFEIRALTYDWNFDDGHRGDVHYVFAQVGPQALWAIVHIDAQVAAVHELFRTRIDRAADDLLDIEFPTTAPATYFTPP